MADLMFNGMRVADIASWEAHEAFHGPDWYECRYLDANGDGLDLDFPYDGPVFCETEDQVRYILETAYQASSEDLRPYIETAPFDSITQTDQAGRGRRGARR